MPLLLITLLSLATPQLPPPNLVENGDARGGAVNWTPSRNHKPVTGEGAKDASIESCDGAPCFVLRNGTGWNQQKDVEVRLFETRDQAAAYLRLYEGQYESR